MRKDKNRLQKRKGFTLIEVLLVVIIIGILAAIVVPRLVGRSEEARINTANAQLAAFKSALSQFEMHCGRFPTTEEGLAALLTAPADVSAKWKGPYLDSKSIPKDPWDHDYIYSYDPTSKQVSLISPGPDGQENTDDDISAYK